MQLTVLDRAAALGLLPETGNFSNLKAVGDARLALSLKEDEVKEYEFKLEGDKMQWNAKGQEPKEIELSQTAIDLLKAKLVELDKEEKLTPNHLPLWEKLNS